MGRPGITEVIDRLREDGYRAARAFPGATMPHIQQPAVAVALQEEQSQSQTLAVSVLYPEHLSGGACEDEAGRVAEILRGLGYGCTQESCRYDGKSGRFFVRILAVWEEQKSKVVPFSVSIGGVLMKYVEEFSSEQKHTLKPVGAMGQTDPIGVVSVPQQWGFTVEELIPVDTKEANEPAEPFSLTVSRGNVEESYQQCYWTSQIRRDTQLGLVKIRTGMARSRSVGNNE